MMRIFLFNPVRNWIVLGICLLLVLVRALFITLMDVDASQYASISMEMLQGGHWLEVQHRYHDYLDKPPLLFWLSAVSFKLFGLSTWAYKLPSFIGVLLGVWGVYRFCHLFYTPQVAQLAAFMLASSIGFLLLCNDVRTDTLLMGMTVLAVWQLAAYGQNNNKIHLYWAGLAIGLAMLAKGPLGLIVPVAAVGSHWLLHRGWRQIFRWEWLLTLPIIALVLSPMCYGLYHQFDLHPDKVINDRRGVSGLYFFFWEQSFGRITGENVWKNNTTVFYFFHVFGWAFLPWTIGLIAALWGHVRALWRSKCRLFREEEGYAIGVFLLLFVALSQSKYKLPHYIFVVLPWAAVLTASVWDRIVQWKWFRIANFIVVILTVLVALLLPSVVFFTTHLQIWLPIAILVGLITYWAWPKGRDAVFLAQGNTALGLLIGFVLHFHFYPALMPYQSSSEAGNWLKSHAIPAEQTGQMGYSGHALDFYAGHIVPYFATPEETLSHYRHSGHLWVYVREGGREQLDAAGIKYSVEARFRHFQPALLRSQFLNPATRDSALIEVAIVRILE